jgi:L-prolyl-PCP dehydrogenase
VANVKVRLEAARNLVYRVAWTKQQGKSAVMEAAVAKLFVSENFVQSCLSEIQRNIIAGMLGLAKVE